MNRIYSLMLAIIIAVSTLAQVRIDSHGDWARIIVDGEPMLILGGELGNSSASVPSDLHRIFPHLRQLGLNTVLAPVCWELIEPEEGRFDMSSLDNILTEARDNGLKVVLLWFGAWKNSMSCYTPEWFKRDTARFPRAVAADGKPVEEASALSANVLEADRNVFCKIMQHLRDNDTDHTVIMVQVENEIGMIEVPRDYSATATAMYKADVPALLTNYISDNQRQLHPYLRERMAAAPGGKTWAGMFGDDMYGEEIFQTWTYATYVEELAKAGRAIYDLPMYVNVALNSRGRTPGQYPSGGPLAHLIDLWRCGAPHIDVLGVDIYDRGFADWAKRYHLPNNPLFIPEIRLEDKDAMYAIYAIGHHDAMGFCPFSIEDYPLTRSAKANDWRSMDLSADDQLNAFSSSTGNLSPLAAAYSLLCQAEPLILQRQGSEDMEGILLDNDNRRTDILTPDSVRITVKHSLSLGWEPAARDSVWPEAACMILRLAPMDYLVLGSDVVLTFNDAATTDQWRPGDCRIGIAGCQEVQFADDEMQTIRHLNGDQTHQGRHVRIPHGQFAIQRFRLYRYQ